MASLDQISFDTLGYVHREDRDGVRVWQTPSGDGLGLFHYAVPPDLGAPLDDLDRLRAACSATAGRAGLGVIEIDLEQVDGCRAVRTILKAAQKPSGRTYIGSLTLPFRDFSFVLRAQCAETGTTGVRDVVVLNQLLGAGAVKKTPPGPEGPGGIDGWLADPYDPAFKGPMARNRSESERYDSQFPDHPLSRARAVLRHLSRTLRVSDEVRKAPAFVGPRAGG